MIKEINRQTGEIKERDMTTKEIAQMTPTPEEIQQWVQEETKRRQQEAIQKFQEKQVIESVQQLSDDEAIEMQDVYPLWKNNLSVKIGEKYQDFNSDNEMVLWKVNQGHTTQENWRPKDTPALFVRVGFDGEILDFVQPTGAHDAYKIGDKVKFNGLTYESVINGNVYSPTAYPAGWKQL